MKRILACLLALTFVMSVTSCSSLEETKQTDSVPENFHPTTQTQDSSINAEKNVNQTQEGDTEQILTRLLKNKIDAAINDDFSTYCSYSSKDFWKNLFIEQGEKTVTDDDVTEWLNDSINDGFLELKYVINETGIQSSDIYDFEIEDEHDETENGITIQFVDITFKLKGSNDTILGEAEFLSDGNEWDMIKIYLYEEIRQNLKDANSNAKMIYNYINEVMAEHEIIGDPITYLDFDWVIDNNYDGDDIKRSIYYAMEYCEPMGRVYVYCDAGGLHIQWTADENIGIIGQYPNPPTSPDEQPEWGEI